MAERFVVQGGRRLQGELTIRGAKNAVLPLLAACMLAEDEVVLENCPNLADVDNMLRIVRSLGCQAEQQGGTIRMNATDAQPREPSEELGRELRSSVFMLGPILGRFGQAVWPYPGGCEIGLRPIDLHIKGLRALGADLLEQGGKIICRPSRLHGAHIHLDYPSVGATENIMMAASVAQGETVLYNAAREPEVEDLQALLCAMGAKVAGAGEGTIRIQGVSKLHGATHRVVPDRITTGTFLVAAAMTHGDVHLLATRPEHLIPVIEKLREAGCVVDIIDDTTLHITAPQRLQAIERLETSPYPGFPTDMQAQFFAMETISRGVSCLVENVFENRFRHAHELVRMGAKVVLRDRTAMITGVETLFGNLVTATDLRGGAAMVLAGLAAQGTTTVHEIGHIDRGYEHMEVDLQHLGAAIARLS